MNNIHEVAIATWRLEKWLANANVEKKMAAKSSIRSINSFLRSNNVEVQDLTGSHFDSGLNVDVINNESPDASDEELIISEMVKPIVMQDGAVISRGSVILGTTVKTGTAETTPDEIITQDVDEDKDNAVVEEIPDNNETSIPGGVKGFFTRIWISLKKICKKVFNKESWNLIVQFVKKHHQWILTLLLLLFMIIALVKINHIIGIEEKRVIPDNSTGSTETQSLPNGVEISEGEDRNVYITIKNK